jgi:hypothetical protein
MLAIHTFCSGFKIGKNESLYRGDIEISAQLANLSNKFLQKHKYTTKLFVDKQSIDLFRKIPYDSIEIIDEEFIQTLPKDFWAGGKFYACLKTNEPYIHIDLDLFLIENAIQDIINNSNLFYAYEETWIPSKLNIDRGLLNRIFDNIFVDQSIKSYNCSIFGVKDYLTYNKCVNFMYNIIQKNNDSIDQLISKSINPNTITWLKPAIIEQIALPNYAKIQFQINKFSTVINPQTFEQMNHMFKHINVLHLSSNKHMINSLLGMDRFISMLNRFYF